MKFIRAAIIGGLFAFVLFQAVPTYAQTGGFPDKSLTCHAVALDQARGWTGDACGEQINAANCSIEGDVNKEAYIGDSFRDQGYVLVGEVVGFGKTNCKDKLLGFVQGSAVGTVSKFVAAMYTNPPASTTYYAYDLLHNAGFVEPAYAQGIGYSGLMPLLSIWKAFRNVAYVILVVILVAIGFMIMFRMKVDAQTAIGLQTALPNVIITLILITFSYAIAGLLIDLMYFLILLIISVFDQHGLLLNASHVIGANIDPVPIDRSSAQAYYLNANWATLMNSVVFEETIFALPYAIVDQTWLNAPGIAIALGAGIFGPIGWLFSGGAVLLTGLIPMVLIVLALLFTFVRVFFILLNSYIQVLLSVIFSPLQLLLGAIPGRNAFRNWIMGLIGNLIVFPVTALLLMVANTLSALALSGEQGALWSPPFLVGPVGSEAGTNILVGLVGFGIIMLMPSFLGAVKNAFAPKPALPITAGIVFAPVRGVWSTTMGILQSKSYFAQAGIDPFSGRNGRTQ